IPGFVAAPLFGQAPSELPTLEQTAREFYGSERARQTLMKFPSRGQRTDPSTPPKGPVETIATFKLMEDLEAEVVLHEPIVRQPVFLNFDERGRMWVVQFLQYPYPAGVKVIDFDDQFHAVYDKVPPPPPHHDRGADKITIHEDRDGDGTFETHKVFLDGLNMVTAVERGRGGVWVLNPPYLVFWPDRNDDDVPDGDPTIHLAGFGLEDTHSAANSLRWGPDGWLYGTQGSGVSSRLKRPGLDSTGVYFKGQVVWRYHPQTRAFELFAEGGGNTFGLEFDAAGRAWSGINGSGHRGFHFVQGGYYSKNFGEHGFFTNPYTFGYINAMAHEPAAPRFSHTFVIYEGGALSPTYHGRLIATVPLQHEVMLSELRPAGSSYTTRDRGEFLRSTDKWFRPVDIKTGPDGAVYIADWYDTRLSHMDPRDTWDRARGRIYRVRARSGRPGMAQFNYGSIANERLVDLLGHANKWHRQTALRILSDRRDSRLVPKLAGLVNDPQNPRALDALWAVQSCGGFDGSFAKKILSHPQPLVRAWTVRLIGDTWSAKSGAKLPDGLGEALKAMVPPEPNPQVRAQIASTARRLPGQLAVDLIFDLAGHDADAADPHIPLLLWWALETQAVSQRSSILHRINSAWSRHLVREQLVPRLARYYAMVPTTENQQALADLLRSALGPEAKGAVLRGINEAFKGRPADALLASLEKALDPAGHGPRDPAQLALAVRRADAGALREAVAFVLDADAPVDARLGVIEALGESRQPIAVAPLLQLLAQAGENSKSRGSHILELQQGALAALGRFDSGEIAQEILARWSYFDATLQRSALGVLCSRKNWAKEFLLAAGASGTISKADVPNDIALRIRLFGDKELDALCDRYFGNLSSASTAQKQKTIERIVGVVRTSSNANLRAGKEHFAQRCAICHTLFGEGLNIGPDLTGSERTNLENMLLSIVDPSVAIREGFTLFRFELKDGRDLLGFIADRDGNQIRLRDAVGQVTTFPLSLVAQERIITTSMMPEGLLDDLNDQALRDLFGYLMR
ncbi:MAG TPA: PVC-type heme-binding CxxCH protein, partial [Verrucomicrobiae bacterium]|nr:PVC-type heme-binding CxxCH protein [Verrucomicrobiae bacterium]